MGLLSFLLGTATDAEADAFARTGRGSARAAERHAQRERDRAEAKRHPNLEDASRTWRSGKDPWKK